MEFQISKHFLLIFINYLREYWAIFLKKNQGTREQKLKSAVKKTKGYFKKKSEVIIVCSNKIIYLETRKTALTYLWP